MLFVSLENIEAYYDDSEAVQAGERITVVFVQPSPYQDIEVLTLDEYLGTAQ